VRNRLSALRGEMKPMGEFVTVAKASDLAEGGLSAFDLGGTSVAVANVGGTLYAFGNICTHRRCPLAKGELDGTTVTCPCHGSMFDVTTGAVLRGPAEEPVGSYAVRAEGEEIQVAV
jgi:nitrite reductase/ring-hydroxylating ferredoxin subunit